MTRSCLSPKLLATSVALCLYLFAQGVDAHGSVGAEDDLCQVNIGYLKAHFKIYLPRTHGHKEFCEDVPVATESVFVMEYMHRSLGEMPIDFRIIRDVTGMGRFAKWEHVSMIDDLDAATVFYQPAIVEPDVFAIVKNFVDPGWYIGIITALPPDTGKTYMAVFPFQVGFTGFGYWPYMIGLMVLLQIHYWYMSGSLSRWRKCRYKTSNVTTDA
jgi:hypothetical protein